MHCHAGQEQWVIIKTVQNFAESNDFYEVWKVLSESKQVCWNEYGHPDSESCCSKLEWDGWKVVKMMRCFTCSISHECVYNVHCTHV